MRAEAGCGGVLDDLPPSFGRVPVLVHEHGPVLLLRKKPGAMALSLSPGPWRRESSAASQRVRLSTAALAAE
jgi:hypothetical protein